MAAPTATATVPTARLPFGKLVAWAGAGLSAAAHFIILALRRHLLHRHPGPLPRGWWAAPLLVSNLCNAALPSSRRTSWTAVPRRAGARRA